MARTAQQVIESALKENRFSEIALYACILLLFLVGLAIVLWTVWLNQAWASTCGPAISLLVIPMLKQLRDIRQEKLKLRLIEVPLGIATTEKAAAAAIVRIFEQGLKKL